MQNILYIIRIINTVVFSQPVPYLSFPADPVATHMFRFRKIEQ